jgi:hypothetical protein
VKLRVAINAMLLRLAVPAMRLGVAATAIKLLLAVPAMRLQTAIGFFVAFLRPADTARTTDVQKFDTTKSLSDVFNAASVVVGHEVRKAINDGAGLDDGSPYFAEDYVVGGVLAQTYTLPDQVVRAVGKVLADAPSAASVVQISTATNTVDAFSAADDREGLAFGKVLGHGVGATDDINGAMPLDDQTIEFFKSVDHVAHVGDAAAAYLQREFGEVAGALAENPTLLVATAYFETPAVAEAYAVSLGKTVADAAQASEASAVLAGKSLSETADAASSGSVLSQGYTVDMTYFAEDYVGTSRTF